MNSRLHLAIGAVSALAIAALPLKLEALALGSLEPASVLAKNGNGGGNGGGRGGGKGHSGAHGKSADAGGRAKSGGKGAGSGRAKSTFGQEMRVAKGKKATDTKVARTTRKSVRALEVAALPKLATLPIAKPKEEKLNARLAGLNSLKRNYQAYLNSQDPRMASIRAFVLASANLDIANEKLTAAEAAFAARVAAAELEPYDDAVGVYDDPTLAELQDRLDRLENATVAPEDLDAWQAEKAALESLLDSAEAEALAQAEDRAEPASVGTDDEALRQALLDAANRNRIAQYGEENYVNDDVMDWAKDVLGVGEDFGKIDEVRETLD